MSQGKFIWADQALSTNPPLSGVDVLTAVPWNAGRGSPWHSVSAMPDATVVEGMIGD